MDTIFAMRKRTEYSFVSQRQQLIYKYMNKIGRAKEIPRIIVPQGAQRHIASHFGVSGETVRRALKYIINTELAVRIREEAIKNYGGAESIIRVKI